MKATLTNGGYRISGRAPFVSNCHDADWISSTVLVDEDESAARKTTGSNRTLSGARWRSSARSPRLAGVRLRERLETDGWRYQDGTTCLPQAGRTVSECYPYTTIVGASELGYEVERPRYKRKPPRLPVATWRPLRAAACDELVERIAGLRAADPPMDLRSHPVTAELLDQPSPIDDRAYKLREDLIDACIAAWTAALWRRHGTVRCQVLGAEDTLVDERGARATIIAPARPQQLRVE